MNADIYRKIWIICHSVQRIKYYFCNGNSNEIFHCVRTHRCKWFNSPLDKDLFASASGEPCVVFGDFHSGATRVCSAIPKNRIKRLKRRIYELEEAMRKESHE